MYCFHQWHLYGWVGMWVWKLRFWFAPSYCIPGAKRGYYGFIIVAVRARVRRDFLLATYSPHFFPDYFHIWQVASYGGGLATLSFW